jgi:hypothetical protein
MFSNLDNNSLFTPEQVLENRGRVAIFIDGSNLFYAALQLGIEIDYTKLLSRLTAGSRLLRSFTLVWIVPMRSNKDSCCGCVATAIG